MSLFLGSVYPAAQRIGFTLIELLIAIGLGMMVVLTTMTAFRAAAQANTIANRMSLENAVLRAGVRIARDEVDFWTGVDDPDNPTQQKLRQPGTVSPFAGSPSAFTDMSSRWQGALVNSESGRGYDPRDSAWAMGNPRVWWRGNYAEKLFPTKPSDLRFGRYGIFANTTTTLNTYFKTPLLDANGVQVKDAMGKAVTISYGQVQVPHTWLFNQLATFRSLGHYAMMDYLPANALFTFYQPYSAGNTSEGGYLYYPRISDGWQGQPLGRGRATQLVSPAIPDPRCNTAANLVTFQFSNYKLANYWVTYGGAGRSSNQFYGETAYPDPIMTSGVTAPQFWPGLTVRMHRFIKTSRFVNWARVTLLKPLTGEEIELSFTSFGTTLRGARQQRRSGGGWAYWDNAGNSRNDVTLDGVPVTP